MIVKSVPHKEILRHSRVSQIKKDLVNQATSGDEGLLKLDDKALFVKGTHNDSQVLLHHISTDQNEGPRSPDARVEDDGSMLAT